MMRRIMIIDDDPTSLAIGRAFLEDEYEVSLAQSGRQALGALELESTPDLILLDILMPGIDGLAVLRILKQTEKLRHIPVIFLTGERSVDLEIKGYSNGASDFLLKPVNRFLLKTKISRQFFYAELEHENHMLKHKLEQLEELVNAPLED